MLKDKEFWAHYQELKSQRQAFAVATVIQVLGSASARPGSLALINSEGRNVWGWVGGGCAESFVASQALEAIEQKATRIVKADLDDEIFGLGMPCGGIMDVYIEPQFPLEEIVIADFESDLQTKVLTDLFFEVRIDKNIEPVVKVKGLSRFEAVLLEVATRIALKRNKKLQSLSLNLNRNEKLKAFSAENFKGIIALGTSRITEEVARFAAQMNWPCRVMSPAFTCQNYPVTTELEILAPDLSNFTPTSDHMVLIASHHKGDPEFIAKSMANGVSYIAMVASRKRSGLIAESLKEMQVETDNRLFAPAGLNMNCQTPQEIALSLIAEMILFRNNWLEIYEP